MQVNDVVEDRPKAKREGELLAAMHKDQLRSLFYLFSGKPDSRIKVFSAPVHLKREDIVELNDCVTRKLATHSIDATITSVKISYDGSEISEFGTWAEFQSHHWQEPNRIEEIVVKWDFLVRIDNYEAPQRHTLLLRISKDLKPGKIFQMVAAGNADEFDQLDMVAAPAFCRVDFINAQISKELINIVSDWYGGRKSPELIPELWYWFKKHRQFVAELFDHWLLLSWALLIGSFLFWAGSQWYGGNPPLHVMVVSVFFAIYSLRPMARLSHVLASRIYKALMELEGSRVVFEFTSGDRKRISELKRENRKQGQKFIWTSVWNLALNILAAVAYAVLFAKSFP
jgi:hypothetical protein